jgi:hypothetical protein
VEERVRGFAPTFASAFVLPNAVGPGAPAAVSAPCSLAAGTDAVLPGVTAVFVSVFDVVFLLLLLLHWQTVHACADVFIIAIRSRKRCLARKIVSITIYIWIARC